MLQLRRSEPLHRRLPQEVRRWPEQLLRLLPPPHRDRDEGGSNKERRRHKHRSRDRGGRFDKESLKKCFQYKAKKREKAFLAQLSDLDKSSDTDRFSSPTSDDDDKKKKRDKEATGFIGLCLAAGRRKSFCTMVGEANGARASSGGHATPKHSGSSPGSESGSEVNSTIDLLDTEVRELYAALDNQKIGRAHV